LKINHLATLREGKQSRGWKKSLETDYRSSRFRREQVKRWGLIQGDQMSSPKVWPNPFFVKIIA
jgi:hypothetical protein